MCTACTCKYVAPTLEAAFCQPSSRGCGFQINTERLLWSAFRQSSTKTHQARPESHQSDAESADNRDSSRERVVHATSMHWDRCREAASQGQCDWLWTVAMTTSTLGCTCLRLDQLTAAGPPAARLYVRPAVSSKWF